MKIVRATTEHALALSQLNLEFNGVGCSTASEISDSFMHDTSEIVAIAYENDTAIGFICGQVLYSVCYKAPYGEITELYVTPRQRLTGIASKLIAYLENCFLTLGVRELKLLTGNCNQAARSLYESLGYVREDEVLYQKEIS